MERVRYLGWVLSHTNDGLLAMYQNLKLGGGTWGRVSKMLSRQEVPVPMTGTFYQAVLVVVLLYRTGSWVLTPSEP